MNEAQVGDIINITEPVLYSQQFVGLTWAQLRLL